MDPLSAFRDCERRFRGNAAQLLRGEAVLAVALAWRAVPVQWRLPESPVPVTEAEIWRWIWTTAVADVSALAEAAGVDPGDVRYWIRVLVSNRLIYPDGTIAAIVDEIAERKVADAIVPGGLL